MGPKWLTTVTPLSLNGDNAKHAMPLQTWKKSRPDAVSQLVSHWPVHAVQREPSFLALSLWEPVERVPAGAELGRWHLQGSGHACGVRIKV